MILILISNELSGSGFGLARYTIDTLSFQE